MAENLVADDAVADAAAADTAAADDGPAGHARPEAVPADGTVVEHERRRRPAGTAPRHAAVGTEVEVHNGFSGRWVGGFAVAEAGAEGLRLRRTSDRSILPEWFSTDEVRRRAD